MFRHAIRQVTIGYSDTRIYKNHKIGTCSTNGFKQMLDLKEVKFESNQSDVHGISNRPCSPDALIAS